MVAADRRMLAMHFPHKDNKRKDIYARLLTLPSVAHSGGKNVCSCTMIFHSIHTQESKAAETKSPARRKLLAILYKNPHPVRQSWRLSPSSAARMPLSRARARTL